VTIIPVSRADPGRARCIRRGEQVPDWDLRGSDKPGTRRAICTPMVATNMAAAVLVVPAGQGCDPHQYTAEHVIFPLEGMVEFDVGGDRWLLEPFDLFFLPANVEYTYRSVGDGDARFLSITGRLDEWPGAVVYADDPVGG
jgi:quercetin dioxygenase-like cupin family protein